MQQHLEAFAIVVEQESLNQASRILNISQPALSRRIMQLEEDLGVALFERRGKRLHLTRAGQLCYEHAIRMRELNQEFERSLRAHLGKPTPRTVTIGASLTTLQSTLPELVQLFTADYPDTDIKAVTGKTHEIVNLIKEKKADIGLIASEIDQEGLLCHRLFADHLCLVLPPEHPWTGKSGLRMESLNDLPMILFSKGTWYRVLMDELFDRHGVYPNVKMEIDSFEAILRLACTLQAATLLPLSYLRRSLIESMGMTVAELPELRQAVRTTCLILPAEAAGSRPYMEGFIQKAKQHFGSAHAT